ncbi:UNVERIFIED_CONTAM: hypothetical protein O8I53_11750 [Campylobacter lari]
MIALSDFTGINFLYTLNNSYDKSNINNYNFDYVKITGHNLNDEQKSILENTILKRPALDFVSNLYATGTY